MKNIIVAFIFITIFLSCEQKKNENDWMIGGTLHGSKVSEWKTADEQNKLATCADFVSKLKKNKGEKYASIEEMKTDAIDMKACIDEAIKGDVVNNNDVAEIAVGCEMM